uniref:Uncharacterized protein n=1 Tax=Strigamia maritima TaxID=126957 RepID=T1IZ59_STRMM
MKTGDESLFFNDSDGYSILSPNERLLQQYGRNGSYILTEDTQKQITKLHKQEQNKFRSAPLTKFTKKRYQMMRNINVHDIPFKPDISSEESRRLLDELKPDMTLLDIQSAIKPLQVKIAPKTPKKVRKHTTRTAPAAGFKSLYQLSLMLGKGFNIDDLYLVQDSFSKENIRARNEAGFGPLPFSTINPPVTVVSLKPQLPSTRYEPLPLDYIATVRPIRKEAKEMFNLQDSYNMNDKLGSVKAAGPTGRPMNSFMNDIIKVIDPELAQIDSDVSELRKVISNKLMQSKKNSHEGFSNKTPSSVGSVKATSSSKPYWICSSSSNSISSMSKCGLLRKDVYDLSDEESTPDGSENGSILGEEVDEMGEMDEMDEMDEMSDIELDVLKDVLKPHLSMRFEDFEKSGGREEVVMFNYKNLASSAKEPSNSNELPSSRESTKANASLTSRVGLEDVNSEERSDQGQTQSSERAHPLCNTVTPGTMMRTYEQAIGKDVAKGAQRSHTFSGLESKSKKGNKDRLAFSFPTIFQHHNN